MISRILPQEEWPRLDAFGMADIWPTWNNDDVRVCVVENESGQIVDHWIAIRFWHVEGLQVHHPSSFRRLWKLMADALFRAGVSIVWTGTTSDNSTVQDFIARKGGQELPMRHYVLPVTAPVREEFVCRS